MKHAVMKVALMLLVLAMPAVARGGDDGADGRGGWPDTDDARHL